MKIFYNIIYLAALTFLTSTAFGQNLPSVSARIAEASGLACASESDCEDGIICYDIFFKVSEGGWNLQSYNIWIKYGANNTAMSFASEDPCYHQKGGALNFDDYGMYRVLAANYGLALKGNKETLIHNFCLNIENMSKLDNRILTVGGDYYGLASSVNLVSQTNSNNSVSPFVGKKRRRMTSKTLTCLTLSTGADYVCSSDGLDLLTLAQDATGNTIPDDCEPYTYAWKGPNGFSSIEASPEIPAGSPYITSGDFFVTVTGVNGCEGTSMICVNGFECNMASSRTTNTDDNQSTVLLADTAPLTAGFDNENDVTDIQINEIEDESFIHDKELIHAYPNPTSSELIVECDPSIYDRLIFSNSVGKVLFRRDIDSDMTFLDLSKFQTAIYQISLVGDEGVETLRILKSE